MLKSLLIFLVCLLIGSSTPNILYTNKYEQLAKIVYKNVNMRGFKTNEYVVLIDFSLPSSQPRLIVVNIKTNKVVLITYVAHGTGSGGQYATHFSNIDGSHESSLGVYITLTTYYGHNGLSLKVRGIEDSNSNAYNRAILVHGANYIGNGKTGRSWGCFAVPKNISNQLIDIIKNGAIIFAYNSSSLHSDRYAQ
jgi:hypothetical protein